LNTSSLATQLFSLQGRRALVTGAGRGIGSAIASGLASFGADVIIHDLTAERCVSTCHAIQADGGTCSTIGLDLGEPDAGQKLIETAGPIDILIINASAQINGEIQTIDDEDFSTQVAVNLRSTVKMLQACLPQMAAKGWGRVVSIGSINQSRPKPIVTMYAATKAAQHNIIQSLARQYARQGVLLNTLAPGLIDTDRNAERRDADPDGWSNYVENLNFMGRAGAAQELVGAAVFLSSEACSFMTGETIYMTGGF